MSFCVVGYLGKIQLITIYFPPFKSYLFKMLTILFAALILHKMFSFLKIKTLHVLDSIINCVVDPSQYTLYLIVQLEIPGKKRNQLFRFSCGWSCQFDIHSSYIGWR